MIGNLLLILLIGILGIWKSIPVGFVLKIHPVFICLMTIIGASIGIFIIFFIGTKIRKYLSKVMKDSKLLKKENKLINLFDKYGVHGLGIIGTLFMGPNLTMALGIAIVKNPKKLLLWVNIGIIIWTIVLTYVGVLGVKIF
ncbi:MAG: VTT domain-containing protein [Bacteroidetes bacterium]|nr:VTT domain-containing protein [Bacteroidota bacterium]